MRNLVAAPRTKGDPICLRLPLEEDEAFRARAERSGLSVTEYAVKMIRRGVNSERRNISP